METWQKNNTFFTEHLPLADSPISVYNFFRTGKGRRAFQEEEN